MNHSDVIEKGSIRYKKRLFPPLYKVALVSMDFAAVAVCFLLAGLLIEPDFYGEAVGLKSIFFLFLCLLNLSFFMDHRLYSHHFIFLKRNHFTQLARAFSWTLITFLVISAAYLRPDTFSNHLVIMGIFILAMFALFFSRLLGNQMVNLLKAFGVAFFTIGILGFLYPEMNPFEIAGWKTIFSGLLLSMAAVSVLRLFAVHVVFNHWLRRRFRRQALVIGTDKDAEQITSHVIQNNAPYWISGTVGEGGLVAEVPKSRLGSFEDLPAVVEEHQIDEMIVTDERIDKRSLIALLDFAISEGITVWFPPKLMAIIDAKLQVDNFCGLSMIRLCSQKYTWLSLKLKHSFDALITLPGFLLLLPFFVGIAVLIKLTSKGPVFYRATAIGKDARPFTMFKFRTMRTDSDPAIHKDYVTRLIKGEIKNGGSQPLKIVDDPRITSIGKWLRKLSLDELPQLINVLKGDMSLVGPRPCLPYEFEIYKDWHKKRTAVRPGISGLWQVAGRSEVEFEDMILLDLYYIYNRSLLMDLNILYETFYVILGKKGAY
jgi:exopolysaccharide biosynthesis polyprenyl glycosylphosphotransferase